MLTLINVGICIFTLTQIRAATAEDTAPMLRGRGLQIVDAHGQVRASIQVLPASKQKDGTVYPETLLLRLITEKGRPSVKIGSSEESAGIALAGPTGTSNTYVQLGAKGKISSLTLKDEDGHEKTVAP